MESDILLDQAWNHYRFIKILKYADLAVAVASPGLGKVASWIRFAGRDTLSSITPKTQQDLPPATVGSGNTIILTNLQQLKPWIEKFGYPVSLLLHSPGAIIGGSFTVLINRLLTSWLEKTIVEAIRPLHKIIADGAIVLIGG